MKTKTKSKKETVSTDPVISAPGFGIVQHFTADSVTIEEPGSSTTHMRVEVEGWLTGMNTAMAREQGDAVRKAIGQAIECRRKLSENRKRRISNNTEMASGEGCEGSHRNAVAETGKHRTSNIEHRTPNVGRLAALALMALWLAGGAATAHGTELIRGYAPQDGQQLYAADLDNLVDESSIGVQFYNDQQTTPVLGAGYYFLILNPANQTYYRINAQQILYGNTNIFLNAPTAAVPAYGLMLFCDPSNNWVASTTVSNFLWNSASNINVAGLSFANSNNVGATMEFVLPRWPYPLSGLPPNGTNYPAHFLIFDTNGIPYREGLSNLEANMSFDFGTNFALPWEYRQEFAPWQLYGTNMAFPFTNAFGWPTNFPITALYQANVAGSNVQTLLDGDTIPVDSGQQGVVGLGPTNTSASLLSIYEYMTNKNALPPYTMARCQFAGTPAEAETPGGQSITNMDPQTGIITNIALAVNWTNPAAVSFAGSSSQIPTAPQVTSNILYWAQATNWPNLGFQLFTNLANALERTNPITGNGVTPSRIGTLYYVTNYTSVNCAVIQAFDTTVLEPGVYDCFFLTPSATPFYYLNGSGETAALNEPISVAIIPFAAATPPIWSGAYTTNGFVAQAMQNNAQSAPPVVEMMVFPE